MCPVRHATVTYCGDRGGMNTTTGSLSRNVSELYISKVNSLVAAGRESLIGSILAEYDRVEQAESKSVEKAS